MFHSLLTSKGQTTIPTAVRDALNLKAGDRLEYRLEEGGVHVRVHRGAAALSGILAGKPTGKAMTMKQIRAAAAKAAKRSGYFDRYKP